MPSPATLSVSAPSISRDGASLLVSAAMEVLAAEAFEGSVAVVGASGSLRAFACTDEARFLTVDLAIGKAWTAASLGHPTGLWNKLVTTPAFAPMAKLPRVVAVGGGFPLFDKDQLVGAIGISGGTTEQDEAAARAAAAAAGYETR